MLGQIPSANPLTVLLGAAAGPQSTTAPVAFADFDGLLQAQTTEMAASEATATAVPTSPDAGLAIEAAGIRLEPLDGGSPHAMALVIPFMPGIPSPPGVASIPSTPARVAVDAQSESPDADSSLAAPAFSGAPWPSLALATQLAPATSTAVEFGEAASGSEPGPSRAIVQAHDLLPAATGPQAAVVPPAQVDPAPAPGRPAAIDARAIVSLPTHRPSVPGAPPAAGSDRPGASPRTPRPTSAATPGLDQGGAMPLKAVSGQSPPAAPASPSGDAHAAINRPLDAAAAPPDPLAAVEPVPAAATTAAAAAGGPQPNAAAIGNASQLPGSAPSRSEFPSFAGGRLEASPGSAEFAPAFGLQVRTLARGRVQHSPPVAPPRTAQPIPASTPGSDPGGQMPLEAAVGQSPPATPPSPAGDAHATIRRPLDAAAATPGSLAAAEPSPLVPATPPAATGGPEPNAAAIGPASQLPGSAPSRAEFPTFVEGRLEARPGSAEFAPAFGLQISTLARDGVQHARLHLNPVELGPIVVKIAIDGGNARVDFLADAAQTRAAIEASLPSLAGAMRDAGLTLAGGGVFQQSQDAPAWGGQPGGASGDAAPGSRNSGSTRDPLQGQDEPPAGALQAVPLRRGLVDLVA